MEKLNKKFIIEELKKEVKTPLEKRVLNIILNNCINYDGTFKEKLENCFKDYSHGCASGVITELIYYTDTEKFFNRYKKDIIKQLESDIQEGIFKVKYVENEKEYFPVITFNNCDEYIRIVEYSKYVYTKKFNSDLKNTLAWYGFESVIWKLQNSFEHLLSKNN